MKQRKEIKDQIKHDNKILPCKDSQMKASKKKSIQIDNNLLRRDKILEAMGFFAEHMLRTGNLDEGLEEGLHLLGNATGVSRVYIFQNTISPDGQLLMNQRYEWTSSNTNILIDNPALQNISYYTNTRRAKMMEILATGNVYSGQTTFFSEEEQSSLKFQKILAIATFPIFVDDKWWGFIGFDDYKIARNWSPAETGALKFVARTIGAAIEREKAEKQHFKAHFDLELKIRERTNRLTNVNRQLQREIEERKQIETDLQKSKESLTLALDASNAGLWDWNVITGTVFANERYYTMLGLNPDTNPHTFKDFESWIHPDDRDATTNAITRHIERKRDGYELEFRMKTTKGEWIWVIDKGKVVERDSAGNPLRVVGTHTDNTIRKKTEEALKQNEERVTLALEAANAGLWDWDITTGEIFGNSRYYEMLELNPNSGHHDFNDFSEWIHPDDRKEVISALNSFIKSEGNRFQLEYRMKTQTTGSWRWIFDRGKVAIRDKSGKPLRIVGTHADVTIRREAQEALRQSEERFQLALEAAKDGIWDWNVTTGKVFANPQYYTMLGFSPELNPSSFDMFEKWIHPEDREYVVSTIQSSIQSDEGRYELEFRMGSATAGWRWILDKGKVVNRDSMGNPLRVVGNHTNITARKKTEEALRQSEERFQLALEAANDGIWDWDVTTGKVFASPRFYTMLDLDPNINPFSFDTFVTWIHPDDREYIIESIKSHIQDEKGSYELEFRMKFQSGGWRWILDRAKVVERDEAENPLRVVGTHQDITHRKETEAILNKREHDLKINTQKLEEVNTALKVLLKSNEEDKKKLEDTILVNVKELILPYIERLKTNISKESQLSCVEILEANLNNIISPFLRNVTLNHFNLTPREIQVANLVKEGKTTKEIAELFNISTDAVDFHRNKLRTKLGLKNKKANLRSYLLSLA